jgi:hypothetical protein
MTMPLYQFPTKAAYNKVIPKGKIYQKGKVGQKLREKFVHQLDKITWRYVLAPETINLPAKLGIAEIAVVELQLKTPELDEEVLRTIDEQVRVPIVFLLRYDEQIKTTIAYKRSSDADADQWVVEVYFGSDWQPANNPTIALPVALDLAGLYEQLLRAHMPHPPRQGENLKAQVARIKALCAQQQACQKLETQINKEKQFNRKVELNSQLRECRQALQQLM